MDETEDGSRTCDGAISLAFSILGKRWNGMILEVLGAGSISFAALRRAVVGISDAMLSDRLTELAEAGLVVREVEPGPPISVSYTLTRAGCELIPVLRKLGTWASENLTITPAR